MRLKVHSCLLWQRKFKYNTFLLSLLHLISTNRSTNKMWTSQTTGASSLSFKMLSLSFSLYETVPQTTRDAEWAAKCEAVPLQYFKGEVHSEGGGGCSSYSVCLLPDGGLRSCSGCLPTLDLLSLFLFFFVLSSIHQPLHLFYHHPGLRRTSMNGRGWKTVARCSLKMTRRRSRLTSMGMWFVFTPLLMVSRCSKKQEVHKSAENILNSPVYSFFFVAHLQAKRTTYIWINKQNIGSP